MKSRAIYSLGNPGSFDITDKNLPLYYIARFSHEMSMNFYNLETDGFLFKQPEDSDFASFETAFDTFGNNISTWMENAVTASNEDEEIPALPTIPDITDIIPWIAGNPFLMFVAKIAIRLVLMWLKRKLAPDTTGTEIGRILKDALFHDDVAIADAFWDNSTPHLANVNMNLDSLLGLLSGMSETFYYGLIDEEGEVGYLRGMMDFEPGEGETRGLTRLLRKAFMSGEDPNEFSLLELMVQNPIKIWLTRSDLIDDLFISQL